MQVQHTAQGVTDTPDRCVLPLQVMQQFVHQVLPVVVDRKARIVGVLFQAGTHVGQLPLEGFAGQLTVLLSIRQPAQRQAAGLQQVRHADAGLAQLLELVLAFEAAQHLVELGVGTVAQQAVLGEVQRSGAVQLVDHALGIDGAHQLQALPAHP
ncbi:hypothetical protein WR25_00594 [Diploscapter pachys]|uniref:Uncharacterized protein n=1 Tax=Diploscapter pachys TaxID=2018661 RepID=A0A2A2KEI0_9BILA|nr:hypothetical protein WR25_00594 [Diploscapter pachys]